MFFSPESLLTNESWREMLHTEVFQQKTVGFIVDEAHCVKKWYNKNVYYSYMAYFIFYSIVFSTFLGVLHLDEGFHI